MDTEDLELFERSLRNATNGYKGRELDAVLEELGWHDALARDPRAAISTLFALQGATNTTSATLGHVVGYALGLRSTSAGQVVLLPGMGNSDPPGTITPHGLQVNGLALGALADLEFAVVVAAEEPGHPALKVPLASLSVVRVGGADPSCGLFRVTGGNISTHTELGPPVADWPRAVALARLATAHELVGASRKMLELARGHALGRIQFDRPISSFQAIRHRLADTLVAIEMADAMLDAAWLATTPNSAAMAKAVAGRQGRTTARHCQQVLAGIGFTTEHPLHLYVRRTLVLDGLFGTSASLTRALGEEMVRAAQLPPLLPL
jgi:hypothetical protein